MKAAIPFVFAASAAILDAQSPDSDMFSSGSDSEAVDQINDLCMPSTSGGMPDMNAPCNAAQAIFFGCLYGPSYLSNALSAMNPSDDPNDDHEYAMQSKENQRTCFCESQWFDQTLGCEACYSKHGLTGADAVNAKQMSTLSSAYCAVTATPSVGFGEYLLSYSTDGFSIPESTPVPSSYSDPIGNKTDVSLYYTPAVTGSAAWKVAEATGASSGMATFSTTKTSKGQIVATATGTTRNGNNGNGDDNKDDSSAGGSSGASGSAAGTATSTPNSAQTPFVAAAAGLLGVAGLVAML